MTLRRNVAANYLGQGWTALMGLAFIPVYIRYLGIEAWGLVGFMAIMQAWLALLDMGLAPTLGREMARFYAGLHSPQSIRDLLRSLEIIYGLIAFVVVALIFVAAPWLAAHWLKSGQMSPATVAHAITIMGFVLAARMVEQVYRGSLQGMQLQVWLNVAQSLLATFRWGGAVIVLAYVVPSIDAFFIWQGFVSLVTLFIFAHQTYIRLPQGERVAHFDLPALIRVRQFAGGMAATTFLALLLTQVDKVLLTKLISLEDFGYYSLAASVAGALGFLVNPMATAILPRLTELAGKSQERALIATYHGASQWLATLLVPAALVIAVFGEPLLFAWTGNIQLANKTAHILTVLAIGTLFNGFMHVPYMAQLAHGWTSFAVRMNIVAVILIVPAVWLMVPRYGAIGAAAAWLALNAGYLFIGIHFMHHRFFPHEKARWYRNSIVIPLAYGTLTVVGLRAWVPMPTGRLSIVFLLFGILTLAAIVSFCVVPVSRNFIFLHLKAIRHRFR
jgi:O-antigen/teichoic acid export membrane protein